MMRYLYILFAFCLVIPRVVADELPELGDYSATVLSALEEKNIANQIMRDVMSSDEVVDDAEINDYINTLGMRLAATGPDKSQWFSFFVVKDNSINAFAMPGGVIGVHTGLIVAARSEGELAGVLGHEIGHVVQHHLARILAQQKRDAVINMAGMALALLAARANPQLAQAAMISSSATMVQKQLDYTREHEREADRVGIQILENAGYDTSAMVGFFEVLQKGTRFVDGSAPSFLRTHPITSERIADVSARTGKNKFNLQAYSPEFDLIRAKLMANLGSASQSVSYFQDNINQQRYSSLAAQHYGLAIAYLRANDIASAHKELDWLEVNSKGHPYYATLAANIEVAANNPQQAEKRYVNGLMRYPNHLALIIGYAKHLVQLGQYDRAIKFIQDKQGQFPDNPDLYEIKAKAYASMNKRLLSFQAQGEAYFKRYDVKRAYEQIDLAVKAADGDFYEMSIVEARAKELKKMLDDQKKDSWF
jgi:predicted Zn-dependent protease